MIIDSSSMRKQRGIGLIEVLITLVILTVGFLASANLQIRGMRTNLESMQRSQALLSLTEVMDRMRNNPAGVASGSYNGRSTGSMVMPACVATGCSSEKLADVDLFEWSANFEPLRGESGFVPLLPGSGSNSPAVGSISVPVNGVFTLTLNWQGSNDGSPATETLSVQFAP